MSERVDAAGSEDPLSVHRGVVERTIADGDAGAIKQLYVVLGDDLQRAHAGDVREVPLLSAPETGPAVVARLAGVQGLVLDAGCGPNPAVSIELGRAGDRRLVALDIGWGMVDLARRVAAAQGAPVLAVVGDVESLPFRDRCFDGVACDDCIEHLPDDRRGIGELARVARPSAPVVIATPNRHNPFVLRRRLVDRLRGRRLQAAAYYVANSHLREYTWGELEALVAPALRITARVPVGWRDGSWRTRALSRALRLGPLRRLSQMILIEARPRA